MGDNSNPRNDPVWDAAWAWVQRQHEDPHLDEPAKAELVRWLAADPRHRAIYEEASRLWLLAGLVPPVNDIEAPDDDIPGS
jgi:ferric-dicitrate binding protein FerR (iron transport regulator)